MKSEAETRKELIDTKLRTAGWDLNNLSRVLQEFDIAVPLPEGLGEPRTPYGGHQYSDYVLLGRDGKPLAVVEAKKTSKDAAIGREQAKQYCHNIQKQYNCKLPFCFYTNGHDIYFWDLDNGTVQNEADRCPECCNTENGSAQGHSKVSEWRQRAEF